MKWVTRDYVHLDRVASPWLIKRFVDRDAEFVFVPWSRDHRMPADAIPIALPGAELGPHDATGTTFDKIVAKYAIDDPAIARMARVIRAGVAYVLEGYRPPSDDEDGQTAVGLLAFAEGMLLTHRQDSGILDASFLIYDALYANFRTHALVASRGLALPKRDAGRGPAPEIEFLRGVYDSDAKA
jgi:hypothetical protein